MHGHPRPPRAPGIGIPSTSGIPSPPGTPGTPRTVRRGILAAVALLSVLATAACGDTTREENGEDDGGSPTRDSDATANPDAPLKEGLAITFIPKQVNNPYFTVASEGAREAVDGFGGTFQEAGPSDANASSQVSYINTVAQLHVDVIAIAANDPNAVCGALNTARQADIAIVSFDSDTDPDCRDVFVNQASALSIAQTQVELIAEQIGGEGDIAILSATPNATNQNTWIDLMREELDKPEYAGINLVDTVYGNDDDQKSFQETQGLLRSHPDLDGIVSPTTVGVAAAARYLSGSEFAGEVALTGLGTPNQMRQFVDDGTVEAFALWDPAQLGHLAAFAGAALASGQITGAEGETFTAGDLGEYTIGANGEIVLGPPTIFATDNIDDFDF